MKYGSAVIVVLGLALKPPVEAASAKVLATGLKNPGATCIGFKGLPYVTEAGELGKDGDGRIVAIQNGQPQPFASGFDDPAGIVFFRDMLWVLDKSRIVTVDERGKSTVFAAPEAFPIPPRSLHDISIDQGNGIAIVSDAGDPQRGVGGAVFRIDIRLTQIETVADAKSIPGLKSPRGVVFDGLWYALIADASSDAVYRVNLSDRSLRVVAGSLPGAEGLAWDRFGRLFISSSKTGHLFSIPRPGTAPVRLEGTLPQAADASFDADGRHLIIVDRKHGELHQCSPQVPGWEVDETPVAAAAVAAFPNLKWTGWDDGTDSGTVKPLRPVLLTHAADDSNRIFVLLQQGMIHVFDNNQAVTQTRVFLDLSDRVRYSDRHNEEGLLGLAFHPQFRTNGEFFVFYTDSRAECANVLSRFRVKPDDPNAVIVNSEEEILRLEKPDRNHNGGTILFGSDGFLYVTHGDGGGGGDPRENGQNLQTLMGKILRIDINRRDPGKRYAIPADNPFAKQAGTRPEIWAYGFRNVWRMTIDRSTGQIWAADVGDGLFEEINLVQSGGNFGWNLREGLHPFNRKTLEHPPQVSDPVWEYNHDTGRSITGGVVYRGKLIPDLQGSYLYADHISNAAWALQYDFRKQRVIANRILERPPLGVMSFGEDQQGEVYATGAGPQGRCIYRYVRAATR